MSEATIEGGNTSGETPTADEFKAITSQDDLNKIIDDRLKRERSKYADYRDLKAKAAKLDEFEQANQTEAEKSAKRIADLEAELGTTRRDSLRLKIASAHGITDADDIELFLTGTDEESLTRQAERLAARSVDASSPRAPKPDANQGRPGAGGPKSTADSFAEFFRNNLSER
jgi:hypothetical protein